jgi:hypothetical protein
VERSVFRIKLDCFPIFGNRVWLVTLCEKSISQPVVGLRKSTVKIDRFFVFDGR